MKSAFFFLILCCCMIVRNVSATNGNTEIDSFSESKKYLQERIYTKIPKQTLYCNAFFDTNKKILNPDFNTNAYKTRMNRVEWEHVVPVKVFGSRFKTWNNGHPTCRTKDNHPYRGRKCAEQTDQSFRLMLSDMYNLYPVIGSVNAGRKSYGFSPLFKRIPPTFSSCDIKIRSGRVDPPETAKGIIARTYLYFEQAYNRPIMSIMKRKLMQEWNQKYPVTEAECHRTFLIEQIQKNEQPFIKNPCIKKGLWPNNTDYERNR